MESKIDFFSSSLSVSIEYPASSLNDWMVPAVSRHTAPNMHGWHWDSIGPRRMCIHHQLYATVHCPSIFLSVVVVAAVVVVVVAAAAADDDVVFVVVVIFVVFAVLVGNRFSAGLSSMFTTPVDF